MNVMDAIQARRSSRSFEQRPLPRDVFDVIESAITHSPSGSNAQESHFVIVQDPAQIRRIRRFAPGLSGNPAAVIVLCSNQGEAALRGGTDTAEVLRFVNMGIATAYILLATFSIGLGNCPVRSFHHGAIKKILHVPEGVEPELLIAVGYPAQSPRPKTSKSAAEVISYDYFGRGSDFESP